MSRRRLSDDERELWSRVARTANRLQPGHELEPDARRRLIPDPAAPMPETPPPAGAFPRMPKPHTQSTGPKTRVDLAPSISDQVAGAPVQMDRNRHRAMMRGKLDPEARIDLHGMTVAEAHQALIGFVMSAHTRGLRLVLVITGKGRTKARDIAAPMPARAGILKHEVPHWLRTGLLAPRVMEVREAHRSHGGSGAYYVYLRKRR